MNYLILQSVVPVSDVVQPVPSFYAPVIASSTIVNLRTLSMSRFYATIRNLTYGLLSRYYWTNGLVNTKTKCLTLIVTGRVPVLGSTP